MRRTSPNASRPRQIRGFLIGALFLVGGGIAVAAPSSTTTPSAAAKLDADFHAAYPMTAPVSTTLFAGVELGKLTIPTLRVHAREEHAHDGTDDRGIRISFADPAGNVRLLVHVTVAPTPAAARSVVDAELHGVSTLMPPALDPKLGDVAFADDGGKGTNYVIGAHANVAYSVDMVDAAPGLPSAAAVAAQLRTLMPSGAPSFPTATVTLPSVVDVKKGGDVRVTVPGGEKFRLRADGAYVAHGTTGPIVRPFAAGPIAVYATVVDDLGRVTVAKGVSAAK